MAKYDGHHQIMAGQAKISELKDRLSHYLGRVRRGESILVLDRDRVIARIEPAGSQSAAPSDESEWLDALELRGSIRRAVQPLPRGWLGRRPEVQADAVRALLEERDEQR
jgi:antitoxin (DNA-binding transcriptional repressor) of toxin-antitoxin stability system